MMLRNLVLAAGLSTALLFGSAEAALAADAPANVEISYVPGARADQVQVVANLTAAQRATISEYDIVVQIEGQPSRTLVMKDPEAMLYNIMPGTKIHAYLKLKGDDFGTSKTYDGGAYTQPTDFKPQPRSTPSTTPSSTPSSTPTPTRATPVPSTTPSATTPSTPASSAPSSSPSVSQQPATRATNPDLASFISLHLGGILVVMLITLAVLGAVALLVRRQRRG
jgi:hypothetical protein